MLKIPSNVGRRKTTCRKAKLRTLIKASEITSIKNICQAARGTRKTAGGYHWKYLEVTV